MAISRLADNSAGTVAKRRMIRPKGDAFGTVAEEVAEGRGADF